MAVIHKRVTSEMDSDARRKELTSALRKNKIKVADCKKTVWYNRYVEKGGDLVEVIVEVKKRLIVMERTDEILEITGNDSKLSDVVSKYANNKMTLDEAKTQIGNYKALVKNTAYNHKLNYVITDYLSGQVSFEEANKQIADYKTLVEGVIDKGVVDTLIFDNVFKEYSCGNITLENALVKLAAVIYKPIQNKNNQSHIARTANVKTFVDSQFSVKDRANAINQPICTQYIQGDIIFATVKATLSTYKQSLNK